MEDYQKRVVQEHAELCIKLDKLRVFLGSPKAFTLAREEHERMTRQERAMTDYADVLLERITAFE